MMLALEVVLAASAEGTTMVFDEVDAGVGGRAAVQIGRRLARLARSHQVIVVTHLPQVAAYADTHLVVDSGGPASTVRRLDDPQRVAELARMLAGLGGRIPPGRMPANFSMPRRPIGTHRDCTVTNVKNVTNGADVTARLTREGRWRRQNRQA